MNVGSSFETCSFDVSKRSAPQADLEAAAVENGFDLTTSGRRRLQGCASLLLHPIGLNVCQSMALMTRHSFGGASVVTASLTEEACFSSVCYEVEEPLDRMLRILWLVACKSVGRAHTSHHVETVKL